MTGSAKFTDAHGQGSRGGIVWDIQGENFVTAGADARLLVHKYGSGAEAGGAPPVAAADVLHQKPITTLCIAPGGHSLATASIDKTVKLYSYPYAKFESNVTRFTLPVRSLAFSATGGLLAAAGDDDEIKLISTVDNSIARVLKGHDGPVVSLAFDPKNDILASVDTEGTLVYWSLASGAKLHSLKHAAPDTDADDANRNEIAWHPSGDILAVPGHHFDVAMFDRDTAEVRFRMKGGHSSTVGFLAWSPNGKYLATTGSDRKVLIWDTESKQDLEKLKVAAQVAALAWKPTGNALALIDVEGRFGVWNDPISGDLASPADMEQALAAISRQELLRFTDGGPSDSNSDSGSSDDDDDTSDNIRIAGGPEISLEGDDDNGSNGDDEEEMGKKNPSKREKKLRKLKSSKNAELLNELSLLRGSKDQKLARTAAAKDEATLLAPTPCSCKPRPQRQPPFQPGATRHIPGRARFLAYSLLGSVTSSEAEGVYHVEVDFHDTSQGHRMPGLTDFNGFTMAALNKRGSIFANPRRDKSPSTLVYRPCTRSARNSEWSMRFPLMEEVRAVSVGDGWTAAATSLNYLRLFSETGLQRCILSLTGPVVTMTSYGQLLVILTHMSDPLDCDDQVMEFVVLDVREQQRILTGPIPLTPGARLTWLGFSESGTLSSFDSKGVLRIFSKWYDGCWIPVYSTSEQEQGVGNENLWVVGLDATQIFCVKCPASEVEPQVNPKPVLSIITFKMPLAHSDLAAADMENDLSCRTLFLAEARSRIEEAATGGQEIASDEYQLLQMEAELDRCLLRLIVSACKGDKLARALELASMLSLKKSLEGAIKVVSSMHLSSLAEQISTLLEERRKSENLLSAVGTSSRKAVSRKDSNGIESSGRVQDTPQVVPSAEHHPTAFLPPRGRGGSHPIKPPPAHPSKQHTRTSQQPVDMSKSMTTETRAGPSPVPAQAAAPRDSDGHGSPAPDESAPDGPATPAANPRGALSSEPKLKSSNPFVKPSLANSEDASSSDPKLKSSNPFVKPSLANSGDASSSDPKLKFSNPFAKPSLASSGGASSSDPKLKSSNPFAKPSLATPSEENGSTANGKVSVLGSLKKMQQQQEKKSSKEANGKKRKMKPSSSNKPGRPTKATKEAKE